MDSTDEKIIRELQKNSRASFTTIAEKIGVSEGTVRNRVEKLQETGIIEKFTVEINEQKSFKAFVAVNVSTERDFDDVISSFPNSSEIYEIAGDIDLIVKISGSNSSSINNAVDAIRAVEGVEGTKTYMVLSERE